MRKNIYTFILTGMVTAGLFVLFVILLLPVLDQIGENIEVVLVMLLEMLFGEQMWLKLNFWLFVDSVLLGILCFISLLLLEKLLQKKFYTKHFYAVFYTSVTMTALLLMLGGWICCSIIFKESWNAVFMFMILIYSWNIIGFLFSVECFLRNVMKRADRIYGNKHKYFCFLPFLLAVFFLALIIIMLVLDICS